MSINVSDSFERQPIDPAILQVLCDFARADLKHSIRAAEVDWDKTFNALVSNGLLGVAYWYLSQHPQADYPPPAFRESVVNSFRLKSLQMAYVYRIVLDVFTQLNAAGIDYFVVKGPAVAFGLYPDPTSRVFNDLDIVVRDRDWARIHQVLLEMGYEQEENLPEPPPQVSQLIVPYECKYAHPRTGFRVEVHYDDLLNAGLRSKDFEGFFKRSQTLLVKGVPVKVLSLEDQLIHLSAHAHFHGYTRLNWFTDLALIVRGQAARLDWQRLCEIAKTEEAQVPVYYSLRLLDQLLDVPVPQAVLDSLRPDGLRRFFHEWYMPEAKVLTFEPMHRADFSFYFYPFIKRLLPDFLVMGRRWEKLGCLVRFLLPPDVWLRFHYQLKPNQTVTHWYVLHVLIVLRNYIGEVFLSIFRPRAIWEQ